MCFDGFERLTLGFERLKLGVLTQNQLCSVPFFVSGVTTSKVF